MLTDYGSAAKHLNPVGQILSADAAESLRRDAGRL
jgi:hypothetical protein